MENISEKDRINTDVLIEILEEHGIKISTDKYKSVYEIYKRFADHLDAIEEYEATPFFGYKEEKECEKCKSLEKRIEVLEDNIYVFKDSVKRRTGASNVWIDGKNVMYDYR